jgi:hypothetical protein
MGRSRVSTQPVFSHLQVLIKELEQGTKVCINSSVTGVVWLVVISVLSLREVLELLSRFIIAWQVVCPEEVLLLG